MRKPKKVDFKKILFYIKGKYLVNPKYLAICFQVSAYEGQLSHCEPRMDADGLSAAGSSASIRVHPRFVEVVFPGKNPEKPDYNAFRGACP